MRGWVIVRRILLALVGGAALLALGGIGVVLCVDAGYFRATLVRFVAARVGRPLEVAGALHAHLLTRHPQLSAERVTIGNPSWVPAGPLAEIGELSLVMDLPWLDPAFGIVSLSMKSATLHLTRDASGHANWQWTSPDGPPSTVKRPILRRLSMADAHVMLDDERLHLKFDGVVSADDTDGESRRLRIGGDGRLNGHADTFEITGDSLTAASRELPYHFSFTERSSGSELKGRGLLPKPFDVELIDASFEAAGDDLQDLYFLTGVTLVDTGSYRVSGQVVRRGTSTRFADLAATSGQSHVPGSGAADVSGARPRRGIELESTSLRRAARGLRAAGRAPDTGKPPLLLSDAMLKPPTLRRGDADIRFHAKRLQIGRVALTDLAAKGTIEEGILTVDPLTAGVLAGKLDARLRLDATTDQPAAKVYLKITDLELAEIDRKAAAAPPAQGLLQVRIAVTGVGKSVHQVAASANGTVAAIVRHGAIRDSLAEMTGVDLRGLGLLLTKSQRETPLRCAVAQFEGRDGTLTAERVVADTAAVLITGEGQIHLDTETLDLAISGHPKSLRLLRFRAPVRVTGTFTHPSIDVQAREPALIDLGKAKDADCEALEAEAARER